MVGIISHKKEKEEAKRNSQKRDMTVQSLRLKKEKDRENPTTLHPTREERIIYPKKEEEGMTVHLKVREILEIIGNKDNPKIRTGEIKQEPEKMGHKKRKKEEDMTMTVQSQKWKKEEVGEKMRENLTRHHQTGDMTVHLLKIQDAIEERDMIQTNLLKDKEIGKEESMKKVRIQDEQSQERIGDDSRK